MIRKADAFDYTAFDYSNAVRERINKFITYWFTMV